MKRNAVLTEMILAVLFFSLAAIVLLRMLSAAYAMQTRSRLQSLANVEMQDRLERCKAAPAEHVGHALYAYDGDFLACEGGDNRVETRVEPQAMPAGTLYTIAVDAYMGDTRLASLQGAVYAGRAEP